MAKFASDMAIKGVRARSMSSAISEAFLQKAGGMTFRSFEGLGHVSKRCSVPDSTKLLYQTSRK